MKKTFFVIIFLISFSNSFSYTEPFENFYLWGKEKLTFQDYKENQKSNSSIINNYVEDNSNFLPILEDFEDKLSDLDYRVSNIKEYDLTQFSKSSTNLDEDNYYNKNQTSLILLDYLPYSTIQNYYNKSQISSLLLDYLPYSTIQNYYNKSQTDKKIFDLKQLPIKDINLNFGKSLEKQIDFLENSTLVLTNFENNNQSKEISFLENKTQINIRNSNFIQFDKVSCIEFLENKTIIKNGVCN